MPAPAHRGEPDTVTVARALARLSGLVRAEDVATRAHMHRRRAGHALWRLAEAGQIERLGPGLYRVGAEAPADRTEAPRVARG